jgi:hypothetical protein
VRPAWAKLVRPFHKNKYRLGCSEALCSVSRERERERERERDKKKEGKGSFGDI